MADTFDQASNQIDQQRLALLSAIAQYGSQGRDAYSKAMSDLGTQRQGEIGAALASANSRGAPQGLLDSLSSQIGGVYDRQNANLAAGQAAAGSRIADIGANADAYASQVKQSIPALRTQYQAKLAALQQAASQKDFSNQLALKRLQLEGQRLAKGSSGSGTKFSSSLAKAVENRAYDLRQKDVLSKVTGDRTTAAVQGLASSFSNLNEALAGIKSAVDAGQLWDGTGKRPVGKDGHVLLDARVLSQYIRDYWQRPEDNYFQQAQGDVLNEGSY